MLDKAESAQIYSLEAVAIEDRPGPGSSAEGFAEHEVEERRQYGEADLATTAISTLLCALAKSPVRKRYARSRYRSG